MRSMADFRASWCVLASLELIQSTEWVYGLGNTHTHTHTHTHAASVEPWQED